MGVYVVFYLEMSKLIRTFVKITYTPCYMNVKLNNMKTKLVKTKYSDETFYVQLNEKLNIWERVDNGKYYYTDDLIFIRDV